MSEWKSGRIEVWLTLEDAGFGVFGRVVFDDETVKALGVAALSIYGAEREITAKLVSQGYEAAGDWETQAETNSGEAMEVSRDFVPVTADASLAR